MAAVCSRFTRLSMILSVIKRSLASAFLRISSLWRSVIGFRISWLKTDTWLKPLCLQALHRFSRSWAQCSCRHSHILQK